MDTLPSGGLNELERRLAGMQPSQDGLDADRMLFAAGQKSVRRGWGRVAWPVVSGSLALATVVLAFGLVQERSARLELMALHESQSSHLPVSNPALPGSEPPSAEPAAACSYLTSRHAIDGDLESWPGTPTPPADGPPSPTRPILTARSPGDIFDQ